MPSHTTFEPKTPTKRNFSRLNSHLPPTTATIAQYRKRASRKGMEYLQHTAYQAELELVVLRMIAESWSSDSRAKHFNALKGIEQFVKQSMHYTDWACISLQHKMSRFAAHLSIAFCEKG